MRTFASRSFLTSLTLALPLALVGCGGDDGGPDISEIADQPLAGTVGGEPWTLVSGDISTFEADDTAYVATLFDAARAGCDAEWPEAGNVMQLEFPRAVGAYELSSERSLSIATLGDLSSARFAEEGVLIITEIADGHVRGGLQATVDANDTIEGRFDLTLCP